jgi:DNA polymerase (family X)
VSTHNEDIAAAFDEMADLLAIQGANPFRIRAYRRAAQLVHAMPQELAGMHGAREYASLPGIGTDLAGKIAELVRSGELRDLIKVRRQVPPGLRDLLSLPGLGPVRVRALRTGLRIRDRADLQQALMKGRLIRLRGFGPSLQQKLRAALAAESGATPRVPLAIATQYAEPLRAYLQAVPGVTEVQIAGSYRRGRDTVGDLDVLVCARSATAAFKALKSYADLRTLNAQGRTKASGVLRNGLQVDVRVVPRQSFGAALHYFTGSRDHNIHIRRRAQERGCKLSEYGLFRGRRRVAGATEEELFRALELPWIAPELREDRGEIDAAEHGTLPALVSRDDLQGDLHVHTDASDGRASLETMVTAARRAKLRYIAITDHAQHLGIVHGLDAERLARQAEVIDALNEKLRDFVVLKGAEVDILEDGRLALADAVLARLDIVIIAVHGHFDLSEAKQTARVLRALERPHVSILAHPSGRLLGERAPCALDLQAVIAAAHARSCSLEVNGQPTRLDLDDVHVKAACEQGVLLSLASDAHSADQFSFLEGAVRQARRGWAQKQHVLNARPLAELRRQLRGASG